MAVNGINSVIISIHAPPRGATPPVLRMAGNTSDVFQFTPLREGRPELRIVKQRTYAFQFTPLREGRPVRPPEVYAPHYFNSRPSARGDEISAGRDVAFWLISIHAPPRGATLPYPLHCPRPCISIHAPPRGATGLITENNGQAIISIHAPPRGATLLCPVISRAEYISIHAPPRGATRADGRRLLCLLFQFTPLREGRHDGQARGFDCMYFNSRPSARGDGRYDEIHGHRGYFNSRPSARGDDEAGGHVGRLQISIHAPPRGATSMQYNMSIRKIISIHAPPRGATCYSLGLSLPSVFQFTPLREGRLRRRHARAQVLPISIHAPPRGAT